MGEALIGELRARPHCPPITAVVRGTSSTPSEPWCGRMAAAGVTIVVEDQRWQGELSSLSIGGKKVDDEQGVSARCQLVAAHPQVVLMVAFNWEKVEVYQSQEYVVGGAGRRHSLSQCIDACSQQRAQHVVYVSTASPKLFHWRSEGDHCIESLHYDMEEQLYNKAGGIQRWTVLRPVSLMCCTVPTPIAGITADNVSFQSVVDLTTVTARVDPAARQQLIAPSDVGRIAALVLLNSAAYHNTVLELAADCLSPDEEAEERTAVMDTPVHVDSQYWQRHNETDCCGGSYTPHGNSAWVVPAYAQRATVSVEATRTLLPSLLD